MADEDDSRIVFSPGMSEWLKGMFYLVWRRLPAANREQLTAGVLHVTTQQDVPYMAESHYTHPLGFAVIRNNQPWVWLSQKGLIGQIEAWARYVVAHELAHLLLGHCQAACTTDQSAREREADAMARQLGFARPKGYQWPSN